MANHVISANTIADLKMMQGKDNNPVLLLGNKVIGDGAAAHYYWDDDATDSEDTVYLNVIPATGITVGRWRKVISRVVTLPHGILVYNGGMKTFHANRTTASDGTALLNLTMDNTTNGAAMFTTVLFDDSKANVDTTAPADAVSSCRKSLSANLKQLTHLFFRGQAPVISVVGISVVNQAQRPAANNTPVTFRVEGI